MNAQVQLFNDPFERFLRFHQQNPHVYRIFEQRAKEMIAAGRSHYSARAIMEVVRWDIHIQTTGEDFKIDNNHVPFYARMFLKSNPEHSDFFRTRQAA